MECHCGTISCKAGCGKNGFPLQEKNVPTSRKEEIVPSSFGLNIPVREKNERFDIMTPEESPPVGTLVQVTQGGAILPTSKSTKKLMHRLFSHPKKMLH